MSRVSSPRKSGSAQGGGQGAPSGKWRRASTRTASGARSSSRRGSSIRTSSRCSPRGRGDLLYYVMPYIKGESLRAKLGREGELPIGETVRILRE